MARIRKMVICPKCGERKVIENETEKKALFIVQGSSSLHLLTMKLLIQTPSYLKNLSICIDYCPLNVI